ncbi:hypothetical protein FRC18_011182 [Serendipita sp. 400]|nr:hypothetical protein FRC18_011182 [Serendipita sp. 400]
MATIHKLPYELLSLVFRYATLDEVSLEATYTDPGLLATYRFSEYERTGPTFETKSAISKVSRRWHAVSAQYLCEYIYCIGRRESVHWLAKCLEKKDNGATGGHRGQWVRRIDVSFRLFDVDWSTITDEEQHNGEENSYYGWQHILSLTPNVVVVDIMDELDNYPTDWTTQVLFSLRSLSRLRRVEWNGHGADISDLMQLSTLCPQLIHIGITLNASSDSEASTDAFTISLPETQTLLLHWTQKNHNNVQFPPFKPWDIPKLEHFTLFICSHDYMRLAQPLFQSLGTHLRSLELPTLGKYEKWTLPGDFLASNFPRLETLILDVFKVLLPRVPPSEPHRYLRVLGWRLRMGTALFDLRHLNEHRQYFNREAFPLLETVRIVHPYQFEDYSKGLTSVVMVDYWRSLLSDSSWANVVDFEGDPITLEEPEYDLWLQGNTEEWPIEW